MVQPLAASNPAAIPQVRLKANAVAVPALASNVRPALVLAERESQAADRDGQAARHHDGRHLLRQPDRHPGVGPARG